MHVKDASDKEYKEKIHWKKSYAIHFSKSIIKIIEADTVNGQILYTVL